MATPHLVLPRDRLIGREAELARLCRLLVRPRVGLVTLTGPAGVGKTRLALELAAGMEAAGAIPRSTVVDLIEAHDSPAVGHVLSHSLGLLEPSPGDMEDRLFAAVDLHPGLLVLDNFEHVLDAAPLVGRLVARCRSVKVLVTSRAPLRLRGEWVHAVEPLALPPPGTEEPAKALPSAAVRLFVERAAAAQPGFRLTRDHAPAVAAICTRLDGIPLAIEFAAARVATSTPAEVLAALEQGLSTLGEGPRDVPSRQSTLSSAIRWSYDLLDGPEQQLLRALGVFGGSFTAAAAAAVANVGHDEARRGIERLCDLGLLVRAGAAGRITRWRLLETVRAFALDQVPASEGHRAERLRYLDWLAGFAEGFERGVHSADAASWLDRFEAEIPGLRSAFMALTPAECRRPAMRILGATSRFWFTRGRVAEAVELFEPTLRAAQLCPGRNEARAFYSYFFLLGCANNVAPGDFALLDVAVELASAAGDEAMLAIALAQRAYSTVAAGPPGIEERVTVAGSDMRMALDVAERCDDPIASMSVLRYAGHLGSEFTSQAEGKQQLLRCLDLAHQTGAPGFLVFAGVDLGLLALEEGNAREALELCTRALEAAESLGHELGIWYAEEVLAQASLAIGDAGGALQHQARALRCFLRAGQRGPFVLRGLIRAAHGAYAAGHHRLATQALGVFDGYRRTLEAEPAVNGPASERRPLSGWQNDEMGRRFCVDELRREAAHFNSQHRLSERYQADWEDGRRSSPNVWSELVMTAKGPVDGLQTVARRGPGADLTQRETELLVLLAEGLRNDEIATRLVISVKTVERHLSNLYAKLGTRGRAGAVAHAVRGGFGPEH